MKGTSDGQSCSSPRRPRTALAPLVAERLFHTILVAGPLLLKLVNHGPSRCAHDLSGKNRTRCWGERRATSFANTRHRSLQGVAAIAYAFWRGQRTGSVLYPQ